MYTEKYKTFIKDTEEDTYKWKEVIKLKLLEWTLIQSDWCPYKKRICGNRDIGFACTGSEEAAICMPRRKTSEEIKL